MQTLKPQANLECTRETLIYFCSYRWYDKHDVTPAFPFGHGKSYTTFEYSDIKIDNRTVTCTVKNTGDVSSLAMLLICSTFFCVFNFRSVSVLHHNSICDNAVWTCLSKKKQTNKQVDGAEVAQLYLGLPSSEALDNPAQQLKGFQKIPLKSGEVSTLSFAKR